MTTLPDLSLKKSPRKSNKIKIIIVVIIATLLVGAGVYYANSNSGFFQGKLQIHKEVKKNTNKKSKNVALPNCRYEFDNSLGATYANCRTINGGYVQVDFCYGTGCFTTAGIDYRCIDFTAGRCPTEEVDRARSM